MDKENPRLKLEYPCEWGYKVIGSDETALRRAIETVVPGMGDRATFSNRSSGGKYCSLSLTLTVESEEERLRIFRALQDHPDTAFVL